MARRPGTKNLGRAETEYWDDVFARMVRSTAWRESLDQNLWVDAYLNSAATAVQFKKEFEMMRGVLKELEMVK